MVYIRANKCDYYFHFDSMMTYYVCRCFFSNNIFLKQYNLHVTYKDEEQFKHDYLQVKLKTESFETFENFKFLPLTQS